jgi:hypothetical protein
LLHGTNCPLNCDGDGANGQTGGIACYVPAGSGLRSLDLLANAGQPGNWWGIVCDAGGNPFIQTSTDPAPGAYISSTSYENRFLPDGVTPRPANDPNRYLDAAGVPFIVVPGAFIRGVPGAVKGCKCEVEYQGKVVSALVGDVGPDFGEFSLYLCKQFDRGASCHGTSISSGVTVRIWPGTPFPGYPLQPS